MVGDETAGKRRIFLSQRNIIEVLLNRELAGRGNAGVVDLYLVGRPRRSRKHRAGQ